MALAVSVRCLLLYWLFKVADNFEKGLKTHIFDAGIEEMDYWGEGTQPMTPAIGPEILTNASYHLMDEKHLIIDKTNNQNNNNSNENSVISKDMSTTNKNVSKKDTTDFSISKTKSKTKKNSGIPSVQAGSNFKRTRIDSDEFD